MQYLFPIYVYFVYVFMGAIIVAQEASPWIMVFIFPIGWFLYLKQQADLIRKVNKC